MTFTHSALKSALLVAALALLSSTTAHAGRFYVTTERVFAPGERPTVKLEANGVRALDVRLYTLTNPRAWFEAQGDLHRPVVTTTPPRVRTTALLARGARHGLERLLFDVRARFDDGGREVLKTLAKDAHDVATAGAGVATVDEVVPPLADHALLAAWRVALPEREGWIFDEIPIAVSAPGAYLVETIADGHVAYAAVLVSDVALVTKQSASELLTWAIDPASGDPRPGTRVVVKDGAKELDARTTDASGLARFPIGLVHAPVVFAENGKSFTLLDPRFYSANLPEPRVYVFTERPVYRPSQEVFFKGFARDQADERYVLPTAGTPVTVTLVDPSGEVHDERALTLSDRGSFDGVFTLGEDVAMGTWQVVATIEGRRSAGQFKIMSYQKPEVRLTVRLDESVARAGDSVAGTVEGAYFFGAPYKGVEVKLTLSRTRLHVPWYVDVDYAWYFSESEYRNTKRESLSEWTCVLDDKGRCPFEIATKGDSEDFTYVVEAAAIDPTGKTVSGQTTLSVTHGAFRLSIEQSALIRAPGSSEPVVVHVTDHARRPLAGVTVTVTVKGKHVSSSGEPETVEAARETRTSGKEGEVLVDLPLRRGGYYEIVAAAKDTSGKEIVAESFVFASEGAGDLPFTPPDVEIVTDKRSYFAGDTALVLVLIPDAEGHALFTVEGGALYRAEVVRAKRHAALFTVDIGERQTPNFFVSATTVSAGRVYTKQRSVIVPPREKLLVVEVSPDRTEAQPGERVEFTVIATDHAGKPASDAEVALAVVDEAIYAVSPEIAVPLESFFHHKKRNDVRTEESVSFRFFGTARPLRATESKSAAARPFAFGSMKPQLDDVRKVFKDTAAFFPTLVTDGEGRAKATVTLPDNLTSWRATARAVTRATAVGMAMAHVRATKPLTARLALPARFVEGDTGKGALVLQNLTDAPLAVSATISSSSSGSAILALVPEERASWPQELTIPANATTRVPLTFDASRAGPLLLKASVTASKASLSDTLESPIAVAPPTTTARVSESGRVGGDRPRATHALTLPPGARASDATLVVELAPGPLAVVERVLPALVGFPYGCVEQTLSRFLPVLAASRAAKRLGVDPARVLPKELADLDALVDAGTKRLSHLQRDDGGWAWFDVGTSDALMTALVLEGLTEARAQGAVVDDARLARAADLLVVMLARSTVGMRDETRALALYALARAQKPQAAMVRALADKAASLHPYAHALTLLAAHAASDVETARTLTASLAARADDDPAFLDDASSVTVAEHMPGEARAVVLLALATTGGPPDVVARGAERLLASLDAGALGSTRATAMSVRAILASLGAQTDGDAKIRVLVDGEAVVEETFAADARMASKVVRLPRALTKPSIDVTIEGQGAPVFYAVAVEAPVSGKGLAASGVKGMAMKRTIYAVTGAAGAWSKGAPVTSLRTGETALVELEVTSPRDLTYVMIEDPRPAGLDAIERDGTLLVDGVDLRVAGAHREHRDDRTSFFLSRVGPGRTRLYYLARAGLPGSYRALPARVEAMYTPAAAHARSASSVVEVRAP